DPQRSHAVAVNAEILVAALRDDELVAGVEHQAYAVRVLVEAATEALIGNVDEGDQATLAHDFRDLAPLPFVEVGAGRIVAAAVKKRDVARFARAKSRNHVLETDRALPPLVEGIIDLAQPYRPNDRRMVRPGRSADEDARIGVRRSEQLEAEPKRSATSGRLHAGDAIVARMLAEKDGPKKLGEALVAR